MPECKSFFIKFECKKFFTGTGVNVLGKRFGFLDKLKSFNKFSKKHLEEDNLIKSTFHYDKTIDCHFPMWLRKILNTPSWRNYAKFAGVEMNTGNVEYNERLKFDNFN